MRRTLIALTVPLIGGPGTPALRAQQQAPPAPLQVGATAPDFALPGATRYGVLKDPVRLSGFKGKTVVLAFFYKARTKG
jgi:hypothetical protein